MKKKEMQAIFVGLFLVGIFFGYLIPGDLWEVNKKAGLKPLQPAVYDVAKRMGQLDIETEYYKAAVLSETMTGNMVILRIDDEIPPHYHENENHFVYIYKGKAGVTISDVYEEAGPGKLLALPAGVVHSVKKVGDAPVEAIVFSTPPFIQGDTVFLENK